MIIQVKICGLNTPDAVRAVIRAGADFAGFVFFEKSPRFVTPSRAAELGGFINNSTKKVGLVVDANNETLEHIVDEANLDMLQLHGKESPARVAEIREKFGLPVIKALSIDSAGDVVRSHAYDEVADMLLFDAKPPKLSSLPGGNAVSFDWHLLAADSWPIPWMLAGGLHARNVEEAVRQSGAHIVDVSSGVENRPGVKIPDMIFEFLEAAARC